MPGSASWGKNPAVQAERPGGRLIRKKVPSRAVVDIVVATINGTETSFLGFMFCLICRTGLRHRKIPKEPCCSMASGPSPGSRCSPDSTIGRWAELVKILAV